MGVDLVCCRVCCIKSGKRRGKYPETEDISFRSIHVGRIDIFKGCIAGKIGDARLGDIPVTAQVACCGAGILCINQAYTRIVVRTERAAVEGQGDR